MKAKIEAANQKRLQDPEAKPALIDVSIAGSNPGMKKNMVLHAGPPVTWRKCASMKGGDRGMMLEGLQGTGRRLKRWRPPGYPL